MLRIIQTYWNAFCYALFKPIGMNAFCYALFKPILEFILLRIIQTYNEMDFFYM